MDAYNDDNDETAEVEAHGMPILDLQGSEISAALNACISVQSIQWGAGAGGA